MKFLKVLCILLAIPYFVLAGIFITPYVVSAVTVDEVMQIRVDDTEWLDFDEAAALARRLNRATQDIERSGWRPSFDDDALLKWMSEITPMFEYEGLVTETRDGIQGLVFAFSEGFAHNHMAGRSDCETYVMLNYRFNNSVSPWFEEQTWPATLAHELAHVQQGPACNRDYNSSALLENSAQIMSWEVLAALANQGNSEAALSLVYDLRGTALGAARAMSVYENRPDDYERLFYELFGHDVGAVAKHEQGLRFWADRQEELQGIIMRYSWVPLNRIFKARYEQTVYQMAIDNDSHSAEIDDLIYFMQNLEELVDWALGEVERESQGV